MPSEKKALYVGWWEAEVGNHSFFFGLILFSKDSTIIYLFSYIF